MFATYADRLYRLAFRYVKSTADVEDVLITAIAKVYNDIGRFDYKGDGCLEGLLRRIVVDEALMWLRRRHNFNLTESIDEAFQEPDITAFSSLEADDICNMISELPIGYRTVFNLVVIAGYNELQILKNLFVHFRDSFIALRESFTALKDSFNALKHSPRLTLPFCNALNECFRCIRDSGKALKQSGKA